MEYLGIILSSLLNVSLLVLISTPNPITLSIYLINLIALSVALMMILKQPKEKQLEFTFKG